MKLLFWRKHRHSPIIVAAKEVQQQGGLTAAFGGSPIPLTAILYGCSCGSMALFSEVVAGPFADVINEKFIYNEPMMSNEDIARLMSQAMPMEEHRPSNDPPEEPL